MPDEANKYPNAFIANHIAKAKKGEVSSTLQGKEMLHLENLQSIGFFDTNFAANTYITLLHYVIKQEKQIADLESQLEQTKRLMVGE